jgi:hypothetical protein
VGHAQGAQRFARHRKGLPFEKLPRQSDLDQHGLLRAEAGCLPIANRSVVQMDCQEDPGGLWRYWYHKGFNESDGSWLGSHRGRLPEVNNICST